MTDRLDISTTWTPENKLLVTVRNGKVAFADKIDPSSAVSRARMLKLLREQIPGLDTTELEQHVLQQIDAPRVVAEPKDDDPGEAGDEALAKMPDDIRAEADV